MLVYGPSEILSGQCFCEMPNPVYDSGTGFDVCSVCGVVMEMILDETAEYGYDRDGNDISYVSQFSGSKIDFKTPNVTTYSNKLQDRTMTSKDIKHNEMKKTIDAICDAFKIPLPSIIRDQAVGLMEKLEERGVFPHGKKRFASYAVAVFFSCKLNDASRELRSFATTLSMDIKDINYAVNLFRQELPELLVRRTTSEHEVLLNSSLKKMDLDSGVERVMRKNALDIMSEHSDIFETGRKPRTVIAGLLMIMVFRHDLGIDVRKISASMDISHSSVSTAAKEISKMCKIEF